MILTLSGPEKMPIPSPGQIHCKFRMTGLDACGIDEIGIGVYRPRVIITASRVQKSIKRFCSTN